MHLQTNPRRRRLLQALLAAGCGWPGRPSHAGEAKVYFGLQPNTVITRLANAVLKEMHGHYEPDLGLSMTHVLGESSSRCMEAAHKGAADGSTVLCCLSTNLTLLPLMRTMPILNVVNEFVAVAPLAVVNYGFVVGPAVPPEVRTMPAFVAWVRDNPLYGGYGVLGLGNGSHMVALSMARTADFTAKPLPYQTMASMRREVRQGVIGGAFVPVVASLETPTDGRLRLLAVTGAQRLPARPDVPTMRELGLSDVDASESLGFHVPAGTPAAKVGELNAEIQRALGSDAVQALMVDGLMPGREKTPQDYAEALTRERAVWQAVVKKEGFNLKG